VLGRNGTIGSYLFEDAIGRTVTVNTDRYIKLTRRKFILKRRVHMDATGVRRHFSRWGNVNILLIIVRLLTMQCKCAF